MGCASTVNILQSIDLENYCAIQTAIFVEMIWINKCLEAYGVCITDRENNRTKGRCEPGGSSGGNDLLKSIINSPIPDKRTRLDP